MTFGSSAAKVPQRVAGHGDVRETIMDYRDSSSRGYWEIRSATAVLGTNRLNEREIPLTTEGRH